MSFLKHFSRLARHFLDVPHPERLKGVDLYQARVINTASVVLGLFAIFAQFIRYFYHSVLPLSWYLMLSYGLAALLIPWINSRWSMYRTTAVVSLLVGTFFLFMRIIDTGGIQSSTLVWLTLPPAVYALMLGIRAMVFAGALCSFFLWSLWLFKIGGQANFTHVLILFMLIVLHGLLIAIFEKQRRKNELELTKTMRSLGQTRKLASLGTIAGGIAHQINNPLMILLGQVELLRRFRGEHQLTNEQDELLERYSQRLEDNVNKIRSIVDALLVIGRSRPTETFASVTMRSILDQTLDYLGQRNPDRLLSGNFSEASDLTIKVNHVLIVQMLCNLIANGFDATKGQAEGWVRLDIEKLPEGIRLGVSDSGPKLAIQTKEGLFSPFFTTKAVKEGSGLGLILCQTIAELHEGKIYLDEESEFTRFVVELPLHRV